MIDEIYIASPYSSLLWREEVIRRKLPLPLRSESTRTEERVGVRGKPEKANWRNDELVKSLKILRSVIPAPYQVRGKLQPESRVLGVNRDPIFEMVPGFRRGDVWTPVFTGVTTYH